MSLPAYGSNKVDTVQRVFILTWATDKQTNLFMASVPVRSRIAYIFVFDGLTVLHVLLSMFILVFNVDTLKLKVH